MLRGLKFFQIDEPAQNFTSDFQRAIPLPVNNLSSAKLICRKSHYLNTPNK